MADDFVKRSELEEVIQRAVLAALEEYKHECVMNLRPEDNGHMRDLVGAVREIGEGDLGRGIIAVRENHKFVLSLHSAATKIGWGMIILVTSVLGTLGVIAAGVWKQTGTGS